MSYKSEIHEAGVVTLTANQSTKAFTFSKSFTSGVTPVLLLSAPYQTSLWYSNLTNAGFTLNVGTTNAADKNFSFVALRAITIS